MLENDLLLAWMKISECLWFLLLCQDRFETIVNLWSFPMRDFCFCFPLSRRVGAVTSIREHEVALFPSEVCAFPQGAERGDVQSAGSALPVPLQVLPGLLWGETQPVRRPGSSARHEERHLLQKLCGGWWSLLEDQIDLLQLNSIKSKSTFLCSLKIIFKYISEMMQILLKYDRNKVSD